MLAHANDRFPGDNYVSDMGAVLDGIAFPSRHIRSYSTVNVRGIKYGASTHHRGKALSCAFIYSRIPVRINYILSIELANEDGQVEPRQLNLALVSRLGSCSEPPQTPWSDW